MIQEFTTQITVSYLDTQFYGAEDVVEFLDIFSTFVLIILSSRTYVYLFLLRAVSSNGRPLFLRLSEKTV